MLRQTLKNEFFEKNNNIFTPDDAIDVESFELWLFREAMENIARKKQLNLSEISAMQIKNLINMPEEKYRYRCMQDKEK
ncbi:capsular polysaccharide biosynthesis protein, putative [Campylobacter jejuni subsp. jejuni 2008-894]|nr:capsular polysaccharide biosynthesis protein, putative [Campylobacter jejuni subsp. jejuni 2008-894]